MRVHFLAVVTAGLCATAAPAAAQGIGVGASLDIETVTPNRIESRNGPRLVYSVKFLCGEIPRQAHPAQGSPLAPGSYRTVVNIHTYTENPTTFNYQAVLAKPAGPGGPLPQLSAFGSEFENPRAAIEVDCDDIAALFGRVGVTLPAFATGFLRIETRFVFPLVVVGVYTLKNVEGAVGTVPCGPVFCQRNEICINENLGICQQAEPPG